MNPWEEISLDDYENAGYNSSDKTAFIHVVITINKLICDERAL